MIRILILMLTFAALTGCDRTRREPFAPPREVQEGDELRYDDLHGPWTLDLKATDAQNGEERFRPLPSPRETWRFERNGVLRYESLTEDRAGTWKLDRPDRLTLRHPDRPVPDHYAAELRDGRLHLRNRQTGQWLVFQRER